MKRTLLIVGILLLGTALLLAEPTLNGTSGYIIAPSANVEESGPKLAIATGYSMIYGDKGLAHVPFIYLSFPIDVEVSFAVDTKTATDLLLSAKWRFAEKRGTSFAVGANLQLIEVG
ncbi:MAG: hypothetical protein GX261_01070, partial [Spirochaetales bacterium]|nr:hypothetical protein [Spirochaetales bacterium]